MGRILKGAQLRDGKWVVAAPPDPNVVAADLEEPESPPEPEVDLEALVAEAQAQAAQILAAAQAEAEAIRAAARQEGYQQGFSEGSAEGRQAWQERIQALASEAQSLLDRRRAWYRDAEQDVVRLALLSAERILQREARNREALTSILHAALEHLADAAIVRIRVHPDDAPGLAAAIGLPKLEIKPDPGIGVGGAIIETLTGRVDARFVTQFRELAASVLMMEPEDDPIVAPVVAELQKGIERKVPAAEPKWKRV